MLERAKRTHGRFDESLCRLGLVTGHEFVLEPRGVSNRWARPGRDPRSTPSADHHRLVQAPIREPLQDREEDFPWSADGLAAAADEQGHHLERIRRPAGRAIGEAVGVSPGLEQPDAPSETGMTSGRLAEELSLPPHRSANPSPGLALRQFERCRTPGAPRERDDVERDAVQHVDSHRVGLTAQRHPLAMDRDPEQMLQTPVERIEEGLG